MTEMEMVRELRRVVAAAAGQTGGNREKVQAEIRAELVSTVLDGQGKVRETPLAHIMDVVGTQPARTEKHAENLGRNRHHDQRGEGPAHRLPVDAGRSTPTATSRTSSWTGTGSARAWFPERRTTRPSSKPPGTGSEALRKDAELSLAEGAANLGWDQLETAPGLHRFMDHVRQAGDQLQQCQRLRAGNVGGYHGASIGRAGARPFM